MDVGVHGHAYLRVAENLHDHPRWDPLSREQASRGMPKVMEADLWQASALERIAGRSAPLRQA
jgi:hypothetical protein